MNDITIGKNVTYIGSAAFTCNNLKAAYCKAVNPPVIDGGLLIFPKNTPVYVPNNSVDSYKSAAGWNYFSDNIKGYNF